MKRIFTIFLCCLAVAHAEPIVRLWDGDAPGAKGNNPFDIPTLTVFLPKNATTATPAIVVCPGGAYSGLAFGLEGTSYANYLNELGIAAFVLKYRVGSKSNGAYRFPIPNQDAHRAIRLVRSRASEWNVNPRKVGIMGSSAGGHLAAMTSVKNDAGTPASADAVERQSSRPDFTILCYAQTSMSTRYGNCAGSRDMLLGDTGISPDEVDACRLVNDNTPPCFIWHTFGDATVPVQNALDMANALEARHIPYAVHIYHNGRHGLGLGGTPRHLWTKELSLWLQEIGVLGKQAPAAAPISSSASPKAISSEKLLLHVSFDKGTTADISDGRETPTDIRGKAELQPGHSGQALRSGQNGATILYECKDNLDFDHPGTLLLWIKANEAWHENPPPRIGLWGLGNNKGYIGLSINSMPKELCPCKRNLELSIFHSSKRRNVNYRIQPPALGKLCEGWHLVAIAWEKELIFLSIDGTPFASHRLQVPLSNEEFAHSTRFALGSSQSDFLLDDFQIYGRKLTDTELQTIWNR